MIAKTPQPPYYAVIFTSTRSTLEDGYQFVENLLQEEVRKIEGFLGVESATNSEFGITISYWSSIESIKNWKNHQEHQTAQQKGRDLWYKDYTIRICKVEKEYTMESSSFQNQNP